MIEIIDSKNASHQFQIKSSSGSTLLTSIEFDIKEGLETALTTLKNLKITRGNFERQTNHEGKFLFNFKDGNGMLLGASQLYDSEAGLENGIKNLINRLTDLTEL
ncbi:YegP family protein [Zobellia uliginosa]|uniref:YegP family protein n=1 Tax=Zobellia uliginosa TaxID=143224 RepID=UPI001C07B0FF|nr:YegP family protein [Zobellia uliginosa]